MSAAPTVVWVDQAGDAGSALLGGKLGSLAELAAAEFTVPPAFAITTEAFAQVAQHLGLAEQVAAVCAGLDLDDLPAVERASAQLAREIEGVELPEGLESAIRTAYAELERRTGTHRVPVAVRSSGVSEDLEGASFAGQYDTFLWVRGADEVLRHVRRCWAGLFGPQVLTYRPNPGVPVADLGAVPGMCVGVQQMVPARAAGVAFTLDPITGDRSKVVIEGCWGLGEGVVKGDVTPDRYRVDKVTLELLSSDVSTQTEEYRLEEASGEVALLPLDAERGERSCLSDDEVVELATVAKRIERHRGAPQDLEWAVDDAGRLHLLQARPETVWSSKPVERVVPAAAGGAVDRVLAKFMSFGGTQG